MTIRLAYFLHKKAQFRALRLRLTRKICRSMLVLAGLFPSVALSAPASSAAALPGIWEGHVGTLPVRACFVERDGRAFGAYYYLSRLQLIALSQDEQATNSFHEGGGDGRGAPRWQIEAPDPARLTGRWTSGSRVFDLEFHKIGPGDGESGACADLDFHRPRMVGVGIARQRASKDGVAYTRLALETSGHFETTVETFALDGADAAVRRLNETLGAALAGDPPSWFECVSDSLNQSPFEGGFDESLRPVLISRRWLSVTHQYDGFCGGAHPNAGTTYRTFDRMSGGEVDLHDWLNQAAVHRERYAGSDEASFTLQPAFRDLILSGWRAEDPQCDEVIRSQDFWNIGLTRDELVFTPSLPHVVQACGETFAMTFAVLGPYLSREASEHLGALETDKE